MEKNEKKNVFSRLTGSQTHWFLTSRQVAEISKEADKSVNTPPVTQPVPEQKRLNNLDSEMLEDNTTVKIEGGKLKLEYRISDKEKEISEITRKIRAAESIDNQPELFNLRARKQRLDKELRALYKEYTSKDTVTSISKDAKGNIVVLNPRKMPVISAIKKFIQRYILAKVSRKFHSLVVLSDSLDSLNSINRNVDELLKMKTPYGETAANYEKLTEYLSRANKIRSQINKSIKR